MTQLPDAKTPRVDVEKLKLEFAEYLKKQKYRNTLERYLVLDSIVEIDDHFSADELFLHMRQKNVKVSRATIYSTLDLLTKCNILMKHRFQGDSAHFELAARMPNHDHMICVECGHITEFRERSLDAVTQRVCEEYDVIPLQYSLHIYSTCRDPRTCEHNRRAES